MFHSFRKCCKQTAYAIAATSISYFCVHNTQKHNSSALGPLITEVAKLTATSLANKRRTIVNIMTFYFLTFSSFFMSVSLISNLSLRCPTSICLSLYLSISAHLFLSQLSEITPRKCNCQLRKGKEKKRYRVE